MTPSVCARQLRAPHERADGWLYPQPHQAGLFLFFISTRLPGRGALR